MSVSSNLAIPTPASSAGVAPTSAAGKGYSCQLCRQRKVKCDQQHPCNNCTKTDKECNFIAPVRGKRKRTKLPREGLHAKLRRYEELLRSYGASLEQSFNEEDESDSGSGLDDGPQQNTKMFNSDNREPSVTRNQDPYGLRENEPILISRGGATRYLDSDVWSRLGHERLKRSDVVDLDDLVDRPELLTDLVPSLIDEQNSLLLETAPLVPNLASLHPSAVALPVLRDIFADRVDPLMKVLHLPSFWLSLETAIRAPQEVSRNMEALCFAFYLVTASTFDDSESTSILGIDRATALRQYRLAARQALVNAEFLSTSNVEVLQAFAMFMMGVRSVYRHDNLYMLSGVAIRLARKMGLHRDGTTLKLPFFETEMRRRLWWHLVQLDFRLADNLSTRASLDLCACDTASPLNIEDTDFGPTTTEAPPERKGITSIVICRLRSELVAFFREFVPPGSTDIRWEVLTITDIPTAQKDALINRLEDRLEQEYLRYCDPTESIHLLVQIMIRSSVAKMRLFAHNPRQYAESGTKAPQSERDIVFANASKLLEYATMVPGNKKLEKYMWQISTTYLWNTMLYMLIEGRHRKTGPEVDHMWQLIGKLLSSFPRLFQESGGAVRNAVRRWILEGWDDYVMAMRDARMPEPAVPDFISEMRRSLEALSDTLPQSTSLPLDAKWQHNGPSDYNNSLQQGVDTGFQDTLDPVMSYDFPNILAFEMDPNEWSQWDDMVSGAVGF